MTHFKTCGVLPRSPFRLAISGQRRRRSDNTLYYQARITDAFITSQPHEPIDFPLFRIEKELYAADVKIDYKTAIRIFAKQSDDRAPDYFLSYMDYFTLDDFLLKNGRANLFYQVDYSSWTDGDDIAVNGRYSNHNWQPLSHKHDPDDILPSRAHDEYASQSGQPNTSREREERKVRNKIARDKAKRVKKESDRRKYRSAEDAQPFDRTTDSEVPKTKNDRQKKIIDLILTEFSELGTDRLRRILNSLSHPDHGGSHTIAAYANARVDAMEPKK